VLIFSSDENATHSYEFGPEDAYTQYRYASGLPWRCLASLCAVLCRRVRGSQIVFLAENPELRGAALGQENSAWTTLDAVRHASNDLVLTASSTVLLYPTTREGVENAADLIRFQPSGRCFLVRNRDFRTRLLGGELTADAMLDECRRSWIAEIHAGYDTFEVVEGPDYSYLRELLASCIQELNEDYA